MLERLIQLERNIDLLESLRKVAPETDPVKKTAYEWAIRYGLIESIQIVIDTACGVCSSNNLGTPKNYGDCIRLLGEFSYLPADLCDTLQKVVGLRNLLIHEYAHIESIRLRDFLKQLDVFREYARGIRTHLG